MGAAARVGRLGLMAPPRVGYDAARGSRKGPMRRLAAAAALLAACGYKSPSSTTSLTPNSFCAQFFDARVADAVACNGFPQDEALELSPNLDKAVACPDYEKAVSSGRVRFDPKAAQACLDAVKPGTDCVALANTGYTGNTSSPCRQVLTGTVQTGASCYENRDCVEGDYCATGVGCPSSCQARVAVGASCAGGTPCVFGASCIRGGTAPNFTFTCLADADQGQACGGGVNGDCKPTAWCDGTRGAAGTCQAFVATGVSCTAAGACVPADVCAGLSGASLGTCAVGAALGATCTPGNRQCAYPGLYCDSTSSRCAEWPGVGGTCGVVGGELVGCLGSYCAVPAGSQTGTCTAYQSVGGACARGNACGPDAFCKGAPSGVCTASCKEG